MPSRGRSRRWASWWPVLGSKRLSTRQGVAVEGARRRLSASRVVMDGVGIVGAVGDSSAVFVQLRPRQSTDEARCAEIGTFRSVRSGSSSTGQGQAVSSMVGEVGSERKKGRFSGCRLKLSGARGGMPIAATVNIPLGLRCELLGRDRWSVASELTRPDGPRWIAPAGSGGRTCAGLGRQACP